MIALFTEVSSEPGPSQQAEAAGLGTLEAELEELAAQAAGREVLPDQVVSLL